MVGFNLKHFVKNERWASEKLRFCPLFFAFFCRFEKNFFVLSKKAQKNFQKSEINFKKSKIPLDKSTKKW
ncbi:MAG: hypothetical protein IJB94_06575 [Clostridia bacterium]|nr:hypothetical protein [Clostridia bacterium]